MTCKAVPTGFQCEKGQITFSSYDPQSPPNPLTEHLWKIDGTQASTEAQFQQTFSATGMHTLDHSGKNSCGAPCSTSLVLEVVDVIPSSPAAPAAPSPLPMIVGAVLALGLLGIVISKR